MFGHDVFVVLLQVTSVLLFECLVVFSELFGEDSEGCFCGETGTLNLLGVFRMCSNGGFIVKGHALSEPS